ncbi:MAG: poly(R)-hydroxyalkanoic acid synthase subunit PhaE [Nitrospiria bacterium]
MEQKWGENFDIDLYKKFYDIWVRSTSEMLKEMMGSPQFAAALGKSLQGSLDFKKRLDESIESSLKGFRLPTSSDVTELSSRIRALEQQVQGFAKKMEELESHFPSITKGPVSRKQSVHQTQK